METIKSVPCLGKKNIASLSTDGLAFLQVDQAYKNWRPSVQQLLYGMGFQMPRVRKNLCNLVVVMDPTTPSGAQAMQVCPVLRGAARPTVPCERFLISCLHDFVVGWLVALR